MLQRILFVLFGGFWLTMSVLLWRAEFRDRFQPGSTIPVEVVWQRILTAPDNSNLEIRHRGRRLGSLHWSANIGEDVAVGRRASLDAPMGMVRQLKGYSLDCSGMIQVPDSDQRFKLNTSFEFATNFVWQRFQIGLSQRPVSASLRADAAAGQVNFTLTDGVTEWKQDATFAELRDPKGLANRLGGPLVASAVAGLMNDLVARYRMEPGAAAWSANHDWLKIGSARLRCYRLQVRLPQGQTLTVHVSRVGEILKAQLPNNMVLINEEFRY